MSLALVSLCASRPQQPIEDQHEIKRMSCEAKMALITDIVIATLVGVVITLAVLASNGVNLGQISAIGTLSMKSIYILASCAAALIIADIITLIVLTSTYTTALFEANTRLASTDLKKENEGLLAQIGDLTEQNRKIVDLNSSQRSTLGDQEVRIVSLEAQIAAASESADGALQKRLAVLTEEKEQLEERFLSEKELAKQQIEGLEAQIAAASESADADKSRLAALTEEKDQLEERLLSQEKLAKQQIESLEAQIAAASESADADKRRLAALTEEKAQLQARLLPEEELAKQQKELEDSLAAHTNLKVKVASLSKQQQRLKKEIKQLEEETIPALRAQGEALLEGANKKAAEIVSGAKDDLVRTKSDIEEQQSNLEAKRAELQALDERLEEVREEKSELERTIAGHREALLALEEAQKGLEEQIEQLKQRTSAIEGENKKAQEEIERIRQETTAKIENELAAHVKNMEQAQERLGVVKADSERLKAESAQLSEENRALLHQKSVNELALKRLEEQLASLDVIREEDFTPEASPVKPKGSAKVVRTLVLDNEESEGVTNNARPVEAPTINTAEVDLAKKNEQALRAALTFNYHGQKVFNLKDLDFSSFKQQPKQSVGGPPTPTRYSISNDTLMSIDDLSSLATNILAQVTTIESEDDQAKKESLITKLSADCTKMKEILSKIKHEGRRNRPTNTIQRCFKPAEKK